MNGKSGYLVKSKHNNASIFLPFAGARTGSYLQNDGTNGYYWTRSLYTYNSSNADGLYLYSNYVDWPYQRCDGLSVRPVRSK